MSTFSCRLASAIRQSRVRSAREVVQRSRILGPFSVRHWHSGCRHRPLIEREQLDAIEKEQSLSWQQGANTPEEMQMKGKCWSWCPCGGVPRGIGVSVRRDGGHRVSRCVPGAVFPGWRRPQPGRATSSGARLGSRTRTSRITRPVNRCACLLQRLGHPVSRRHDVLRVRIFRRSPVLAGRRWGCQLQYDSGSSGRSQLHFPI